MDFYSDVSKTGLATLNAIKPFPDFVKEAMIVDKNSIPTRLFALPEKRAFPIHDPANTYLSFGYWLLNKDKLSDREQNIAKQNLVKASTFFGVDKEVIGLAKIFSKVKDNIEKKAELSKYALPATREFPLHSQEHVDQAIDLFPKIINQYELPERHFIARAIVKRANDFNIPIHHTIIIKYANIPNNVCREDEAALKIASRSYLTDNLEARNLFTKLAQAMIGNIHDRFTMFKTASILDSLDNYFGINLPDGMDAVDTIFNISGKQALEMIKKRNLNLAGTPYSLDLLANIPVDFYDSILGDDFGDAIKGEDGRVDPDKLEQVVNTLPLPEKQMLDMHLKQYISQHVNNLPE